MSLEWRNFTLNSQIIIWLNFRLLFRSKNKCIKHLDFRIFCIRYKIQTLMLITTKVFRPWSNCIRVTPSIEITIDLKYKKLVFFFLFPVFNLGSWFLAWVTLSMLSIYILNGFTEIWNLTYLELFLDFQNKNLRKFDCRLQVLSYEVDFSHE